MKIFIFICTLALIAESSLAEKNQRISSEALKAGIQNSALLAKPEIDRLEKQLCPSGQAIASLQYADLKPLLIAQSLFNNILQPGTDTENPEADLVLRSSEKFVLDKTAYAAIKLVYSVMDQQLPVYFKDQASILEMAKIDFMSLSNEMAKVPALAGLGNYKYVLDDVLYNLMGHLVQYKDFLKKPIPCLQYKDVANIKFYTSNSNYYLHLNHLELLPSQVIPAAKSLHQLINNSLKKFPVLQWDVQIGTSLPAKDLASLRKGDVLPYQNFLSGSLDLSFMQFVQNAILVVRNKRGHYIGRINPTETELIFYNPQFKLREKKIDEMGRYWLYVDEL